MHGMQDQICSYEKMDRIYFQIDSTEKRKLFFEDGFHEPFLDDEIETYKVHLIQWIHQRIQND